MGTDGQLFTADLTLAAIIFILIIISIIQAWNYGAEKIALSEEQQDLTMVARSTLASLVLTPGVPANWSAYPNVSQVTSLGLASNTTSSGRASAVHSTTTSLGIAGYPVMDASKVRRLFALNMSYDSLKTLLGMRGPAYEFALNISTWNGSAYSPAYHTGISPADNASIVVTLQRYALLNSTWSTVLLQAWQRCPSC